MNLFFCPAYRSGASKIKDTADLVSGENCVYMRFKNLGVHLLLVHLFVVYFSLISLCTLNDALLLDVSETKIFSHSGGFLFTFLLVFLAI